MKEILVKAKAKTVAVSIVAAFSFVGALCFLTATASTAVAQGSSSRGTPPTSVERRTDLSNRQATEYEIEKSSRDLKESPINPADRRHVQEVAEQIKHDFAGLQESHNQLVLFMAD